MSTLVQVNLRFRRMNLISSVIPSDILLLLPNIALRVQISLPRNWLQPVNGYQIRQNG